ncbi:MAG: lysophospholipid acyltransferase family protein [Victivallaceae bacterium]|nr:lysophospholipid acyltransferase family protein [Victivallaceae bacterium]
MLICCLRKIVRLGLACLWMLFVAAGAFFACLGGWGGIARVSEISRLWGAGLCRILCLRIFVHDMRQMDGALLISNHQSYLDVLVHAAITPIRFAPKKEIRSWFLLGWILALSRPVWVDRRHRTGAEKCAEEFSRTLQHGINLVVYPEGTTGQGGKVLLPFKSTAFESALRSGRKIHPVVTCYRPLPDRESVAWYGDMTLLPHVWKMLGEKEICVDVYFLDPITPVGCERKELTRLVQNRMQEKLDEIYS